MSDDDDDIQVEAPDLAEDDPMRAFLPASFGKTSKDTDVAAQMDRSRRTIAQHAAQAVKPQSRPQGAVAKLSSDDDSYAESDSDSESDSTKDEHE